MMHDFTFLILPSLLVSLVASQSACPELCFNKTFQQSNDTQFSNVLAVQSTNAPLESSQAFVDDLCDQQQAFSDCLGDECQFGSILQSYAPINSNAGVKYICHDRRAEFKNIFLPCIVDNREQFVNKCGDSMQALIGMFQAFAQAPAHASDGKYLGQLCSSLARANLCVSTVTQQNCNATAQAFMQEMFKQSLGSFDPEAIAEISPQCAEAYALLQQLTNIDTEKLVVMEPATSPPEVTAISIEQQKEPQETVIEDSSPQARAEVCAQQCAHSTLTINGARSSAELLGVQAALSRLSETGLDNVQDSFDHMCTEQKNFASCVTAECGPRFAEQYAPLLNNRGMRYVCIDKKQEYENVFLPCIMNNKEAIQQQCGNAITRFVLSAKAYNSQPTSLRALDRLCRSATQSQLCTAEIVRNKCGPQSFRIMAEKFNASFGQVSFTEAEEVVPSCGVFLQSSKEFFNQQPMVEPTNDSDSDSDSSSEENNLEGEAETGTALIDNNRRPGKPYPRGKWYKRPEEFVLTLGEDLRSFKVYRYEFAAVGGLVTAIVVAVVLIVLCRRRRAAKKVEPVEPLHDMKI